jgi:hypothetical protein
MKDRMSCIDFKKILITLLLFISVFYKGSALQFVSVPETNAYELIYYQYVIYTDADLEDTIIYSCIKKPDWLVFGTVDHKSAVIEGMPRYNYETGGDSVIISASDSDTTIYQKIFIWVNYFPIYPIIYSRPSPYVYIGYEYDDTLLFQVNEPEYLEMEVQEKPEWLTVEEIPSNFDVSKQYRFYGYSTEIEEGDSLFVFILFSLGSYTCWYQEYFHIRSENFIDQENSQNRLFAFPNPTIGEIYISGLKDEDIIICNLYSFYGNIIDIGLRGNTFNIEELIPGIYLLVIKLESGLSYQFKIIKR